YVRAPLYGGIDSTFTAVNSITASTNVKLTTTQAAQNSLTLYTLNLSGSGTSFPLNAGQTLTLSNSFPTTGGLLKSGVGSAGTISGGFGIALASGAELVIRTDQATDLLTLNVPVLANGSNRLTKSGAGVLLLNSADTYTGITSINAGTLQL